MSLRQHGSVPDKHREAGNVAIELLLLTPALLGFVLLVVFGGRWVRAEGDVARAAHEAARAASLTATTSAATKAATQTASANLEIGAVGCRQHTVDVDTSRFRPGGQVRVIVGCEASLRDLTLLALPGTQTLTATAAEVVDTHVGNG